MNVSDYILGVLYGDGYFQVRYGEYYLFSTTHKEVSEKVINMLNDNNVIFSHFTRVYDGDESHEKFNYEILEMVEIHDKTFIEYLESKDFKSDDPKNRIRFNGEFMRGYLETKGSLFTYKDHDRVSWRVSLSGNEGDINYIYDKLENDLGISMTSIARRREREELGVISQSFRCSIQNRDGVYKFLKFIEGNDISKYLNEKIQAFNHFHKTEPFNMNKIFKHYRYAVGSMAKALNYEIKGIRGVSASNRQKPVFLWEDDEIILCFYNYKNCYKWICKEYKDKTGFNPPEVK